MNSAELNTIKNPINNFNNRLTSTEKEIFRKEYVRLIKEIISLVKTTFLYQKGVENYKKQAAARKNYSYELVQPSIIRIDSFGKHKKEDPNLYTYELKTVFNYVTLDGTLINIFNSRNFVYPNVVVSKINSNHKDAGNYVYTDANSYMVKNADVNKEETYLSFEDLNLNLESFIIKGKYISMSNVINIGYDMDKKYKGRVEKETASKINEKIDELFKVFENVNIKIAENIYNGKVTRYVAEYGILN